MNLEDDQFYLDCTQEIWDFLSQPNQKISGKIDAIFVFGGLGTEIPLQAARLYNNGVSDKVLVTGNSGKFTKDHFPKAEALVFKDIMISNGVSEDDIIVETHATNAGENVALGLKALKSTLGKVEKLVLVSRSYMMIRAIATFKKQFPEIKCFASPPKVSITDIVHINRKSSALRLLTELDRLEMYYKKGFIEEVKLPDNIVKARKRLKSILEVD